MTRFFVQPEEMSGQNIILAGDNYNHAKVLRLKPGEQVLVCDGQSEQCLCQVKEQQPDQFVLTVLERGEATTEAAVQVTVYMAFPKADKLEHVIQKATELGADRIVAFPSARCVSRPDSKSLPKKLERWQKIALSAAQQSGRGKVPEVAVLNSYAEALSEAGKADTAILLYENERATTLKMALEEKSFTTVSLISGPEGGLEEREVEQAQNAGVRVCTLGRRILRCETAPLCALSAVMYAAGQF
jgi:16S rRNA (uracil1498-N3)-methyltransferase